MKHLPYFCSMKEMSLEKLRYPIGHFTPPAEITDQTVTDWITELEALPARMESMVYSLTETQLETPYRPGGWTVRQVIHHMADSHHNCYVRFKWALTEERPLIKAYDEKGWANLFDTRSAPIDLSLDHLKALHAKWVYLLRGLSRESLQRTFIHPDDHSESTLEENIGRYAWHGNHHYAHIENLLMRQG